jgi:NAD(P)-dependent dehydrogenase (short-subunit alcohol dehydrogenase family)
MSKTALITGSAKRLGKEMAIHLASLGWNIAIHYNRSESEAKLFRDQLTAGYPDQQFELFQVDLGQLNEVEQLITRVFEAMGTIDLLINSASVFESSKLSQTPADLFDRHMNINFKVPFILSRNFAHTFNSGVIVNIVDSRIVTNQSNYAAYSLSKKALWEMTKMAAFEFGPEIRVNAIAPGLILAPEDKTEDYLWKLAGSIVMKRPGGLKPILTSLDYILENDYLTGQLLFCDGGENLGLTK